MASLTHLDSVFTPFSFHTKSGHKVVGIHHLPPETACTPAERPLLVGIHGGGCIANYFDLDKRHTASATSAALGVPFVAVNRPGYNGSDPIDLPDNDYIVPSGKWLHQDVLPFLWQEFGVVHGCGAVVIYGHSMGTTATIVAACAHSQDVEPVYPLAGIIVAGMSARRGPAATSTLPKSSGLVTDATQEPLFRRADSEKTPMMIGRPSQGMCEEAILPLVPAQNVAMTSLERRGLRWKSDVANYSGKYYAGVTCSVLRVLGENDEMMRGGEKAEHWEELFVNSRMVDSLVVRNAPHAIEWSRVGQGWYAVMFGWAMQAAADLGMRQKQNQSFHSCSQVLQRP